jgi:hypothetical protein
MTRILETVSVPTIASARELENDRVLLRSQWRIGVLRYADQDAAMHLQTLRQAGATLLPGTVQISPINRETIGGAVPQPHDAVLRFRTQS